MYYSSQGINKLNNILEQVIKTHRNYIFIYYMIIYFKIKMIIYTPNETFDKKKYK